MSRCTQVAKLAEPPYRSYRCDHSQGHLGPHASILEGTRLTWEDLPGEAEMMRGLAEAFEQALVKADADLDETPDFNRPHVHFTAHIDEVRAWTQP